MLVLFDTPCQNAMVEHIKTTLENDEKKMLQGAGKEPGPLHLQISALFRMKTLYHIRLFLSSSHFTQKNTKILLTRCPACAIMTVL